MTRIVSKDRVDDVIRECKGYADLRDLTEAQAKRMSRADTARRAALCALGAIVYPVLMQLVADRESETARYKAVVEAARAVFKPSGIHVCKMAILRDALAALDGEVSE